jgi:acetoin utilization deacetylase AcuC-like enzyme
LLRARRSWRRGTRGANGDPALALVRRAGHHAEPDRAMGFCLYNNIASLRRALRAEGVAKVAIVDIDVHHGNGTQAAFYADPPCCSSRATSSRITRARRRHETGAGPAPVSR